MMYLRLFIEFFKTGLFAVGGGMATLPFLVRMGEDTSWFTSAELANMVAISESTPGPLGINMATYVGQHVAGLPGAIASTAGLVAPCLLISVVISAFLKKFSENKAVKTVFYFLRAAVIGLLCYAFLGVFRVVMIDENGVKGLSLGLFAAFFIAVIVFKRIHPIIWILAGAAVGLLLY